MNSTTKNLVLLTFVAGAVLLFSVLLATGSYTLFVLIFLLASFILLTKSIISRVISDKDTVFWVFWILLFLSPISESLIGLSLSSLSTFFLLALIPFIFLSFIKKNHGLDGVKVHLFLLVLFFAMAITASLKGRSHLTPAVYSFIMYFKPIALLCIGAFFTWHKKTQERFLLIAKWSWLPLLVFALLEWFQPGVFKMIMRPDIDAVPDGNPFANGYPRSISMLGQSAILASYSAFMGLYLATHAAINKNKYTFFLTLVYLILIMMSGQRQEFLVYTASIPLIFICSKYRIKLSSIIIFSTIALSFALIAINFISPEIIENEKQNWDFSDRTGHNMSARALLYADAFQLAKNYWPLGSGMGTFASAGAVKYDQSLYIALGYKSFWWYRLGKSWLMDAYWAKYIAEAGWFAFTIIILLYLLLLNKTISWTREEKVRSNPLLFQYSVLAFVGLFYVFGTSPTAFGLSEVHGGLMPLMFIGIAWSMRKEINSSTAAI